MRKQKEQSNFGVTSLGEKGQVVIPADIRNALKLVKGEKLVAFTHDGTIALVPASRFEGVARKFMAMQDILNKKQS